jgi:hypothetical protein
MSKISLLSSKCCFGLYLLTFQTFVYGMRGEGRNAADTVKIDSFVMTFTSLYTHTSPVLQSSKCYYMTIEGRYHHASDGRGSDGAWHYCYYECAVSGNCNYDTPCSDLDSTKWNFFITSMRPVEDIYQSDHLYEYQFMGADTAMIFKWEDCCYGDNGGNLTVKIFEVDCLDTLNTVGTQIDQENLFINSPGINGLIMKDENGDCWKLTVSTSGALTTRKVICPE